MRLFDFFNPKKIIDKDYLHKPFYNIYKELKIFIDHTKINNDVQNFPLMIILDNTKIDFDKLNSDVSDIRFIDENNNLLPHYFEKIDLTNKQIIVHVKVPTVHASTDTKIVMKYGDKKHYPSVSNLNQIIEDGLIYSNFDNTLKDDLNNHNYNIINGDITYTSGLFNYRNKSLHLLNNNIQLLSAEEQNNLGLCKTKDMAITAWINYYEKSGRYIISNGGQTSSLGISILYDENSNVLFFQPNVSPGEGYSINEDIINQTIFIFISTGLTANNKNLYGINTLINIIDKNKPNYDNVQHLTLGAPSNVNYLFGNFYINNLRIYQKHLNEDEVKLIYHMEKQDLLKFFIG